MSVLCKLASNEAMSLPINLVIRVVWMCIAQAFTLLYLAGTDDILPSFTLLYQTDASCMSACWPELRATSQNRATFSSGVP